MEILRKDENQNLILNKEQDFQTNLGWQENMLQFEDEVLSTIINPIENYETVRYIHKPYDTNVSGLTFSQTDIWYNFYFVSGTSYTQDYNVVGIDTHENAKMLKQSTNSFFRLEFFKTPHISGNTYEPPTRINRKLSFAKNLSLPLGEKYFYNGNNINEDIFFPVFMGSNYRNKENMYLFWFQDESVLSETVLSGDTFWMTVKFFNANDGSIIDFVNRPLYSIHEVNEVNDMYYKLVIDRSDYTYQYYRYTGTTGERVGESNDPIKFYEKKGISVTSTPTPTPTLTSTPTPTPTLTSTPTPTPTSTNISSVSVWYQLTNCSDSSTGYSQEYPEGQFGANEKVTSPGKIWVITGSVSTDPGGTLYAITSTGSVGCEGVASFSTSTINAFRPSGSAGTTTETSGTTITVTYGEVTIRLKTWVGTGYRADTTIEIGSNSYSPDFAGQGASPLSGVGEGNASSTTFTLGIGVYNITNWNVSAISDGSQTLAYAKLEQVI